MTAERDPHSRIDPAKRLAVRLDGNEQRDERHDAQLALDLAREFMQRNRDLARDKVTDGVYRLRLDREIELASGSANNAWDFDGTQARTEHHYHVWTFKRTAEDLLGRSIPMREWNANFSSVGGKGYRFAAVRMLEILQAAPYHAAQHLNSETVFARMMVNLDSRILAKDLTPLSDAKRLMERGTDAGQFQIANTSTPRRHAEPLIKRIGADNHLDLSASVFGCNLPIDQETGRELAKPDPWSYVEATRRARGNAASMVAIEDTVSGAEAAVKAHIGLVIVRPSLRRFMQQLVEGISTRVAPLLEQESFRGVIVVIADTLFGVRPDKQR